MKTGIKFLAMAAMAALALSCGEKGDDPEPTPAPKPSELQAPADPQPNSTDFDRKVMLIDFTGTGCLYCPQMTTPLTSVLGKTAYKNKAVLAVAHMYDGYSSEYPDPAYFSSPKLNTAMGVSAYPTLVADLNPNKSKGVSASGSVSETEIQQFIDAAYSSQSALAGISANSKVDGSTLTVLINVKSAASSATSFRVGMWVLEDGIYAKQNAATSESLNTHNNCVRLIKGNTTASNFAGEKLSASLSAGEVGEYTYTATLDDSWVSSNLKYIVFVSTENSNGDWVVNNVASAKVGESVAYRYK